MVNDTVLQGSNSRIGMLKMTNVTKADKCEGAAGEFVIEATCEDDTYSCKGQKTTDMSKDCVKYCPSSAGMLQ